ncbi:MAG: zinc-ribbon domain-containing protein, partial [Terriglobales bacterium]
MFCERCGKPLQPDEKFCSGCGRSLGAVPVVAPEGRVAKHVRLLGILWIAYSVLHLLGGGVLLILANTLFGHLGRADIGAP